MTIARNTLALFVLVLLALLVCRPAFDQIEGKLDLSSFAVDLGSKFSNINVKATYPNTGDVLTNSPHELFIENTLFKAYSKEHETEEVLIEFYANYEVDPSKDRAAWLAQISKTSIDFRSSLGERFVQTHSFRMLPMVGGELTIEGLSFIKAHPSLAVKAIYKSKAISYDLVESAKYVGADVAHLQYGAEGFGQTVCVVDTGINPDHPAFGNCTLAQVNSGQCPRILALKSFILGAVSPVDDNGHGTHVAGIIASQDSKYRGIAPGSSLVGAKVLNAQGYGDTLTSIAGIDWCLENQVKYNIAAINLSLGVFKPYTELTCPADYDASSVMAQKLGVIIVAASGNSGFTNGISLPACTKGVLSVGAAYDADYGAQDWSGVCKDLTSKPDQSICFSNSLFSDGGPLELSAPGAHIVSTTFDGALKCGGSGGFGECSGTSMAAPHVAAGVALIKDVAPKISPVLVPKLLRSTAVPVFDQKSVWLGGRIDLGAAVAQANAPFILQDKLAWKGSKVTFSLGSVGQAGKGYLFLMSLGADQGVSIPSYGKFPLNADSLFAASFYNPATIGLENSLGVLDKNGSAQITWEVPNKLAIGSKFYVAAILFELNQGNVKFLANSKATSVQVLPEYPFEVSPAKLPKVSHYQSCFTSNYLHKIVCLGGLSYGSEYLHDVLFFDDLNNVVEKSGIKIGDVGSVSGSSCAALPNSPYAYCVGGNKNGYEKGVYQIDFEGLEAKKVATLADARFKSSCVFSSTTKTIFCFGGFKGPVANGPRDDILELDPTTNNIQTLNAKLPNATGHLACAPDSTGSSIYCHGSTTVAGQEDSNIWAFDTQTRSISIYPKPLPKGVLDAGAAYVNKQNQIFWIGGVESAGNIANTSVLGLDLNSGATFKYPIPYPLGVSLHACASSPTQSDKVFCFGGRGMDASLYDTIISIR